MVQARQHAVLLCSLRFFRRLKTLCLPWHILGLRFNFGFFPVLDFFLGFLFPCFFAYVLFCSLLPCLSASPRPLLFCFSACLCFFAFLLSLLFCFSAFLLLCCSASPLFCFCAFLAFLFLKRKQSLKYVIWINPKPIWNKHQNNPARDSKQCGG